MIFKNMLIYFQAHSHFSWIPVEADFTTLQRNALPQVIREGTQWEELGLSISAFFLSGLLAGALSAASDLPRSQSPKGINTAFSNCDSGLLPTVSFPRRAYF